MKSIHLILSTCAALAAAQTPPSSAFPRGDFYITSQSGNTMHWTIDGGSTEPGAHVVLSTETGPAELWSFDPTTGLLVNNNTLSTGVAVATAQSDGSVTQEVPTSQSADANQVWAYDTNERSLQTKANATECASATSGPLVTMQECNGSAEQQWVIQALA